MKNSITVSFLILSLMILLPLSLYCQSAWILQNSGTNNDLWCVTFLNENVGYAVGEGGTIIKTINGGINWVPQLSGINDTLFCVNFINENTGTVVGQSGKVIRTINGGMNWFPQTCGTTSTLKSVSLINANTGFIVGYNGLIRKTTNGGLNWFSQTSSTSNNLWSVFSLNASTGWAVGFNGTVRKTTNGGLNWFSQSVSSSIAELNYVSFLNANTGIIAVGIPGNIEIYITNNSGITWTPRDLGTVHSQRSIDFVDANNWFMVGDEGDFFRTVNGGSSWSFIPLGIMNWLFSTSFVNVNTGWVVGTSGIILKTTTGGITLPLPPVLTSPPNNAVNTSVTPTLMWNASQGAVTYHVQISTVANFQVITDSITLSSNQYPVPSGRLMNGYTYFWRVNASNPVGTSAWSSIWCFSTGEYPPAPILISPPNGFIGTTTTPTLVWDTIQNITSYRIEISRIPNFLVLVDSSTIFSNQYIVPPGLLFDYITYFWRVNASNSFGAGPWSEVWSFTPQPSGINLIAGEIPTSFNLYQNYPNPFNPLTNIQFDIPKASYVKIVVYDNLGRMVSKLIDENLIAGSYEVTWTAKNITSGLYFYKIETKEFTSVKKMILIK